MKSYDIKKITITTRQYQIYDTTVSLFVFLHHIPSIEKMVSELNLEETSIENIFKKVLVKNFRKRNRIRYFND